MNYKQLQQELKTLRTNGVKCLQGVKLNQKAIILQTLYTEIINESRKDLGQPEYQISDLFPPKPEVQKSETIYQVKEKFFAEIGSKLTSTELKVYFSQITFHHDQSHKEHVLNFCTLKTWQILAQYVPKLKLSHDKVMHPEKYVVKDFAAKTKDHYKFSNLMNLKSA